MLPTLWVAILLLFVMMQPYRMCWKKCIMLYRIVKICLRSILKKKC